MLFALLLLVAVPLAIAVIAASISAPAYHGPVSDHFNGKEFFNPGPVRLHGLPQVLKWMLNRKKPRWKEDRHSPFGERPLAFFKDGIRITFVNHSTFLIQVDSLNILTDPVWSRRVSPFRWIGPRRMRPPGIRLEDLPRIHLILLSHNHYDHLDIPTMRTLFGAHHPRVITPLGVKKFLDQQSITGATDLDWWQETAVSETVSVRAVPAQHFSGRGMLDRNKTLWCGFVINSSSGKIYFAGDTGYDETLFKDIGERCRPLKLSMIPIGAYKPRWFMSPVHVSPDEAVKIHQDVGSQKSIGCHFGTFLLADESPDEPVHDLSVSAATAGIADEFVVLKEGAYTIVE